MTITNDINDSFSSGHFSKNHKWCLDRGTLAWSRCECWQHKGAFGRVEVAACWAQSQSSKDAVKMCEETSREPRWEVWIKEVSDGKGMLGLE